MSPEKQIRSAAKARYNKCRRTVQELATLLECPYTDIGDDIIAELRRLVEDLNQCAHETNAYQNAYNTIRNKL